MAGEAQRVQAAVLLQGGQDRRREGRVRTLRRSDYSSPATSCMLRPVPLRHQQFVRDQRST